MTVANKNFTQQMLVMVKVALFSLIKETFIGFPVLPGFLFTARCYAIVVYAVDLCLLCVCVLCVLCIHHTSV